MFFIETLGHCLFFRCAPIGIEVTVASDSHGLSDAKLREPRLPWRLDTAYIATGTSQVRCLICSAVAEAMHPERYKRNWALEQVPEAGRPGPRIGRQSKALFAKKEDQSEHSRPNSRPCKDFGLLAESAGKIYSTSSNACTGT